MRIDHLGYLVKDMERTVSEFLEMGYQITKQIQDESRKVSLVFMENVASNGIVVELVQPTAPDSVVAKMLKRNGVSPYHICYLASSLEDAIKKLKQRHWVVTVPTAPAPAFEGRKVVFLYHNHGGLIELLEEEKHGQ